VDLTWTASTDDTGIDRYEVYRNGSSTPIGSPTGTSFSDLTVAGNTTYTNTVKAFDAAGNGSPLSDPPASVTTPVPPALPPAFRGASTGTARAATSILVATPAGTAPNDVLLASIDMLGTGAITAPAGWSQVRSDVAGSTLTKVTFIRVAVAGEPASHRFTFAGQRTASGIIVAYSGVDTAQPIDVSGGQANGSSATVASPSVAQSVPNARLVGLFGIATNAAFTPPGGMTERAEIMSGTGNTKVAGEVADEVHPEPGDTHVHAATANKAAVSIGHIVLLRPAGS
jgi:hypothetical protein